MTWEVKKYVIFSLLILNSNRIGIERNLGYLIQGLGENIYFWNSFEKVFYAKNNNY